MDFASYTKFSRGICLVFNSAGLPLSFRCTCRLVKLAVVRFRRQMGFGVCLCGCPCYVFILYSCCSFFHLKMTLFYLNCFQRQSVQPSRCTNEGSLSLKCAKGNFLVSFNFRKISVCYFFSSHLIPEWRDRNIRFFVLIFNGLVVLIKELWVLMWICHLISQACLSIY